MAEFVWELPATRPPSIENAEPGEGAVDHAEAAVRRLPQQFRKPKIEKFLRILCKPMATLEQAFVDLLTNRSVETAVGEQLNVLGRIVGQPQVEVTDTTFRSLIRARIKANKSSGMGNQILVVARAVLTDYAAQDDVAEAGTLRLRLLNNGHASYVLVIEGMDTPWDLAELVAQFLDEVSGSAISPRLTFVPLYGATLDHYDSVFRFGSVTSPSVGNGPGSVTDDSVGAQTWAATVRETIDG